MILPESLAVSQVDVLFVEIFIHVPDEAPGAARSISKGKSG
jgi:hypothetical protein